MKFGACVRSASREGEWERVESDMADLGWVYAWSLLGGGVVGMVVVCLAIFWLCDGSICVVCPDPVYVCCVVLYRLYISDAQCLYL